MEVGPFVILHRITRPNRATDVEAARRSRVLYQRREGPAATAASLLLRAWGHVEKEAL